MAAFSHIQDPIQRRQVATLAAFGLADLYVLRASWEG